MPFNPQQINPVDLNPNVAVGVNLPLNGPAVFISNFTTKDAIKNNLINFFLTNPGERYLNTGFGGGLRAFIFEQIAEDNLLVLEKNLESKIKTYFPNVIINSLNLLRNDDINQITIQLKYSISNSNISDNLTIQL
jgi:phage baseplate assembly protein W